MVLERMVGRSSLLALGSRGLLIYYRYTTRGISIVALGPPIRPITRNFYYNIGSIVLKIILLLLSLKPLV